LTQTAFKKVPDFTEAQFQDPPRLDQIQVALPRWRQVSADPDCEARFRVLKDLALAAQDHETARIFLKSEQSARRRQRIGRFVRLALRY